MKWFENVNYYNSFYVASLYNAINDYNELHYQTGEFNKFLYLLGIELPSQSTCKALTTI